MSEEKKNDKFKVYDKRKFDASGNPREPDEEEEPPVETAGEDTPDESSDSADESGHTHDDHAHENAPPIKIDFKTFIISLGSQAMMAMGLLVPQGEEPNVNLEAARQLIDIIAMLREKTRGNLEADEITTIDNLLYDLRMSVIEIGKRQEG